MPPPLQTQGPDPLTARRELPPTRTRTSPAAPTVESQSTSRPSDSNMAAEHPPTRLPAPQRARTLPVPPSFSTSPARCAFPVLPYDLSLSLSSLSLAASPSPFLPYAAHTAAPSPHARAFSPAEFSFDFPFPAAPHQGGYTLSTNPPNPRAVFRAGDWICRAASCAAHNFGRNLACIGCGCARPATSTTPPAPPPSHAPSAPPRDAPARERAPHVLTPSGRAFAVGGRTQNVSTDPLAPCVVFWPANEPLPEQGQIRPSGLVGFPHPPILNTGNRGPIEHQPGDWVCKKCNYLNWRRRKVCQTCYPYAEGNGDSISAAVQAERIALLRSFLEPAPSQSTPVPAASAPVSAPPHARSTDSYLPYAASPPIYQTRATAPSPPALRTASPAPLSPPPLLPSFLHDLLMPSPPSLSPSTVSTPLSPSPSSAYAALFYETPSPGTGIWRLDGDERKELRA